MKGHVAAADGPARPVTLDEKLALLARAFPGATRIETHTAFVFLTADRALKIKKPIALDFLDHRSLAAREHACTEELRLNRQLAGDDVYLGLEPVVIGAGGQLALGGDGRVVDWLVVMRRLPATRILDEVLKAGKQPSRARITDVAARLVRFYRERQGEPARPGVYQKHLTAESAVNTAHLADMTQYLGGIDAMGPATRAEAMIAGHAPEIAQRDTARLIIEGHGDLRPEHVCLTSPPVIFDRIEFASEMLMIDIFDEVNYLGLECAMLGAPWIGEMVLAAMEKAGFAAPSDGLMKAYTVFRCMTRARLSIDHLRERHPRKPEKWPRQAQAYLARATQILGGQG
ncbi:hypothetical protein [Pseudogemmobacter sp. W21_MBD1_M6]|uniref:hypothetical protein n=1 Tax=Pseudogemmobacter sp. W21_MBD1_M6 TaxID=3240271 RepID=UPI003F9BF0A4